MQKLIAAFAIGLWLTSCVPSTPQARIQENPRKFTALSAKQRSLIEQGQICRGMSFDAVYLAWGSPSGSFQGSQDGKNTERWDYAGSRPVQTTAFYGSYGYGGYGRYGYRGYGPYGRHGGPIVDFGFEPQVAYIPYRVASVWFIDQRVDSWERAK